MKLKITDKGIREKTYDQINYKNGNMLYKDGKVYSIQFSKDEDEAYPYHIEGIVQDGENSEYEVNFKFDKKGILMGTACSCYKNRYYGLCEHRVAALYKIQYQQSGGREIKWEDARLVHQKKLVAALLNKYEDVLIEEVNSTLDSDFKVSLQPKIRFTEGHVTLELLIGAKRFYVIKDLFAFIQSVDKQEEVTYGKELTFNHVLSSFDEVSLKVLSFVRAMVKDQLSFSTHYQIPISQRRGLHLSAVKIRQFHQLMLNEKINILVDKDEWKSVLMSEQPERIQLRIQPGVNKGFVLTMNREELLIHGSAQDLCIVTKSRFSMMKEEDVKGLFPLLKDILNHGYVYISSEQVPQFLSLIYPRISPYFDEESQEFMGKTCDIPELNCKVYLDVNEEKAIESRVEYEYDHKIYNAISDQIPSSVIRDKVKETQLMHIFECYDFSVLKNQFLLQGDEKIYEFMKNGVPALMAHHEVNVTERFKGMTVNRPSKVSVGIRLQSDLMTFKMEDLAFDISEYQDVLAQYRSKKKYHRLKDGTFLELESDYMQSFFNLVDDLELTEDDLQQDEIQLSKYRALYFERMFEKNEVKAKKNKAFRQLINDFEQIDEMEYDLPSQLKATLRPYQETGYRWLRTLTDYGMGGILADDMGLGKTLQVIALLCSMYEQGSDKPSLIVSPSSLVFNWKSELERFAPHLRVLIMTGSSSQRSEKLAQLGEYDVILTSYDLLRRDVSDYNEPFKFVILDEAHYIKNQATLNAKAVKKLQAEIRFALTGTPLENSIADVWSIFDFILPGYLLSYSKFKKQYETPIVKQQDEKLLARVHQLVAPFILRRLKKEVLTELPDKIESVVYCELEHEQQKIYEATLVSMNQELQADLEQQHEGQSRMKMLAMLTRLRQLCCHPSLYLENYQGDSAKLNLCLELIEESIESGHRILLFSQFTSMFDLIAPKLEALGISYFTLTGETKSEKRVDLANRFNEGEAQVFLISLKAGGTGLNLTGADVVIHYDPWWNMSAQNQATDRAYRMGQQNKVQVYKLIAKHTIEEKIERLQQRKLELSDSLVKEGETFITHLSTEDIQDLFTA